jgi:hypothetical protein
MTASPGCGGGFAWPAPDGGFKFSTDPHLEAKVADVVGLYLNPPDNAVVVCVDEKSQCQALERTQPIPPDAQRGRLRRRRYRGSPAKVEEPS